MKTGSMISLFLVMGLSLATSTVTVADDRQRFESGVAQVPLIELYTSEGCSSCPPADRWMAKLVDNESLWRNFVPVAFHVDYWDYIGWKDKYASKQYSQRQRRYAAEFGESTVYTPGMRKAGEIWQRWRFFGSPEASKPKDVGRIVLDIANDRSFKAEFSALESGEATSTQLSVALLGLNISSEVSRGENRGKTLEHDFVVLGVSTFASAEQGKWEGELPTPSNEAPAYAVAAWVTQGGSLVPIQATGGYLN